MYNPKDYLDTYSKHSSKIMIALTITEVLKVRADEKKHRIFSPASKQSVGIVIIKRSSSQVRCQIYSTNRINLTWTLDSGLMLQNK